MFKLLDVAPLPVPSRCGRKVIEDIPYRRHRFDLDSIGTPIRQVKDSISDGVNSVGDSLSSVHVIGVDPVSGHTPSSLLVWVTLAVLVALIMCICFALKYRKRQLA